MVAPARMATSGAFWATRFPTSGAVSATFLATFGAVSAIIEATPGAISAIMPAARRTTRGARDVAFITASGVFSAMA